MYWTDNRSECFGSGKRIRRSGEPDRYYPDQDGWNCKGGIAVAIQSELNVPVKYIGVGETIEDLQKFDVDEFVNALFDVKPEEETSDEGQGTEV